ncbi:MAG TPA: energy transducer TonB [Chitinophagaceae bacterium]|nr:energy transducer TonB [Chitinophagaceae bacterium]
MEAGHILSADVLDIIFDARNKDYGAYDLRKNYQRRLMKALVITLLLVILICLTYVLLGSMKPEKDKLLVGPDIHLQPPPPPPKEKIEVPPPPPPPPPAPSVKMLALTAPLIVKDDVKQEDMPPPVEDLETAKIGLVNSTGADDVGIVGPPVPESKGVVETPKKQDEGDVIFTKVEIESQYPGGVTAWAAFLNRKLNYPQDASDNGIQGTVIIQFIVDLQGNVSDVMAISGPEELRAAAITVIKQSNKWTPAIQNGKTVKSYKKQPITFKIPE